MAGNLVNVFSNDPNAQGLGLVQVVPPDSSRFAVPGWTGAGGLFNPGTPEFQAGQLHIVLNRTWAAWSNWFGANLAWQSGAAQLPVVPRASRDINAYYDRQGLKFCFDTDKVTGQTLYTCESSDIVAHECGHAILDANHPEYWDSLLAETVAFHEAFGDITAILVTLDDPQVRAAILAGSNGDLRRSNAVSRLAEQLARGMVNAGKADLVVSADAMRDVVNSFRYRDPDALPGRAPASRLSSESHSFSRVFSGAVYDLLVGIYEQLQMVTPGLSPDAALAQARDAVGRLLARGLILAPRGDATFRTIAAAIFNADSQNASTYYGALRKAFVGRRIIGASQADVFKPEHDSKPKHINTLTGKLQTTSSAPMAPAMSDTPLGIDLAALARATAGLAKQAYQLVDQIESKDAGRVFHYTSTREVELTDKALGVARGAMVTLVDGMMLQVDAEGKVISSHRHTTDRAQEKRIHDHVAKLVARGRLYESRVGQAVDTDELISQKQPYMVAYDEQGKKRIRRAFIACGH